MDPPQMPPPMGMMVRPPLTNMPPQGPPANFRRPPPMAGPNQPTIMNMMPPQMPFIPQ